MILVLTLSFGIKTAQAQNSSPADHKFTAEAASGGMAEVKLRELAQQKGASEKVKEFGQRMVTDHTKAGDELKQVAQQQNLNLPEGLSKQDQATYDRLSKVSGKQFDEAYTRAMVSDHRRTSRPSKGKHRAARMKNSSSLPRARFQP